jgi:hypothetical protein
MRMRSRTNIQADRNKLFSQTRFEPTWLLHRVVIPLDTHAPGSPRDGPSSFMLDTCSMREALVNSLIESFLPLCRYGCTRLSVGSSTFP